MFTLDTERRADGELEIGLSGPLGAAAGIGLAALTTLPILLLASDLAAFQFFAVQLGFIGAIYFGFGVADGSLKALLVESNVAIAFLAVGAAALWADEPWVLAAGYAAHAGWDLVHHPRAALTPVRNWYPPFCVAYDLVVALAVVVWLV